VRRFLQIAILDVTLFVGLPAKDDNEVEAAEALSVLSTINCSNSLPLNASLTSYPLITSDIFNPTFTMSMRVYLFINGYIVMCIYNYSYIVAQ